MTVARTAIQNGRALKMLASLLRAGPKAAQAAATTGKVASKGTPWGWIATAGYAVGSAGWFAYHARAFNLAAFELVRLRDGIELPTEPPAEMTAATESFTLEIKLPTAAALGACASELSDRAGKTISSAFGRFRRTRT